LGHSPILPPDCKVRQGSHPWTTATHFNQQNFSVSASFARCKEILIILENFFPLTLNFGLEFGNLLDGYFLVDFYDDYFLKSILYS